MRKLEDQLEVEQDGYTVSVITRTVTQAVVRDEFGEVVSVGRAVLNPEDHFDEAEGRRIAVGRAYAQSVLPKNVRKGKVEEVLQKLDDTKLHEQAKAFLLKAINAYFIEQYPNIFAEAGLAGIPESYYEGTREYLGLSRETFPK